MLCFDLKLLNVCSSLLNIFFKREEKVLMCIIELNMELMPDGTGHFFKHRYSYRSVVIKRT